MACRAVALGEPGNPTGAPRRYGAGRLPADLRERTMAYAGVIALSLDLLSRPGSSFATKPCRPVHRGRSPGLRKRTDRPCPTDGSASGINVDVPKHRLVAFTGGRPRQVVARPDHSRCRVPRIRCSASPSRCSTRSSSRLPGRSARPDQRRPGAESEGSCQALPPSGSRTCRRWPVRRPPGRGRDARVGPTTHERLEANPIDVPEPPTPLLPVSIC